MSAIPYGSHSLPPARPESDGTLANAAETLVGLLSTLAHRQHEHRKHTAAHLTTITSSCLLPAELHEMATQ